MTQRFKAACIQMSSGPVIADNLAYAAEQVKIAAEEGAQFIATPENTCHIRCPHAEKLKSSPAEENHPALPLFTDLARQRRVWVLIGSLSVKVTDDKIANRSYLISDQGQVVAYYDKIHMFDIDLENGESYRESAIVQPGNRLVLADTPWGQVGMSVCYDLRFPGQYRKMAKAGASIFTIPAAFTVPTGHAHWESLMRARAIENGAFVIAPAQCGIHDGGRTTYGHSMIVSPWGDILAKGDDEPGIIFADIDMAAVKKARCSIPSLLHDQNYSF